MLPRDRSHDPLPKDIRGLGSDHSSNPVVEVRFSSWSKRVFSLASSSRN